MGVKLTRAEKCDESFMELYNKLLKQGIKETKAVRETRSKVTPQPVNWR